MLATGFAALPGVVRAQRPQDTAPPASDVEAWARYAARLEARAVDAGGGRFDPAATGTVLRLANAARAEADVGALRLDPELVRAASAHVGDLVSRGYVEHLSPEGFDPSHRLWLTGRTLIGSPSENIAFHRGRPAGAAELVGSWRRSSGHWRNLLRPSHTDAGFAVARLGERAWLVGLFARPLARLNAPLPLRATEADISTALATLPSDLGVRLTRPQGARPGPTGGVRQLSALRAEAPGRYAAIGGPILLPPVQPDNQDLAG